MAENIMGSPDFEERRKKRRCWLTLAQKVEICSRLARGVKACMIMKEYNISSSTVSEIKSRHKDLVKFYDSTNGAVDLASRKNIRKPKWEELERQLLEWYHNNNSSSNVIEGPDIINKAKELRTLLKLDENSIKFSEGWLMRFKNRYGLTKRSQRSKSVSWTQMRVPDEVAIQEVNPNLDVYMDNGPCVESTSKVGSDENSMQLVSYSEEAARQQENTDAQILGVSLKEIQEALNERRRLPSEKRKTNSSSVWRHFKRHPLHPNIAICNYCRVPLRTAKGSTSGLHRHALRHQLGQHKAAGEEEEDQGEANLHSSDEVMAGDLGLEQMDSEPYPIQVSSVQSLRSSPPPPVLQKELSVCQESVAIPKERPPMNKDRSKAITQKVAEMLVLDYQPSSIVQNRGFRNLLAELEPKYSLPSASFFSGQVIPEMYEKMIEKRRKEYEVLIKECKWCSLSVDRWTSRGESSAYLSVTCHHFAEAAGVSHQFLGVRHLPGKQSGQDIHRTIVSALEEWGFDTAKTQMYVVTDSSRELQAAASSAKIPWTVIQCFSHGMHLVVRGAMDEMPGFADLAQKARDVSHRYNTVEGARKELKQHLKRQVVAKEREDKEKGPDSDPEAKSAESSGDKDEGAESEGAKPTEGKEDEDADPEGWEMSDGATSHGHWVSEYKMLERLVRLKGAIKAELGAVEMPLKADLELTDDEWRLAEAVVEVLSPLVEALRDFCSSEYPPLSMTVPIVYGMEHMFGKVLQEAGAASPDPKATPSRRSKASTPPPPILPPALFARNLLKGVRSRFPSYKTNRTSLVAMVLDPRYKAVILTEQEVDLVTKMLVDEITETPSAAPAAKPKESSGKEGEGGSSISQENKRASTSSLLWSAFEEVSKDQPTGSGKKVALYQVKQYLDEPVLSRDCEPLSWWSENREKYDLILPVARKYASIPATQVVGSVVMGDCVMQEMNARKLCLPEAEVRQLVFLHMNS